jgi:leader peptidase (prepilin peptidase) / N-methyltransferase
MTFGGVPQWMILPWLFVFGACVGSFLNVCIYRIPLHERLWDQLRGLTHPPSTCPFCRQRILSIDNIPVFGWLMLRGRCRNCRHWIPPRYAIIEFGNGLLWMGLYMWIVPAGFQATVKESCLWSPLSPLANSGMTFPDQVFWIHAQYFYYLVMAEALLVATFIDLDLQIIPDGSTIPAMLVGVTASTVLGRLHPWPAWFDGNSQLSFINRLLPDAWFFNRDPSPPEWLLVHPHWHGLLSSLAGIVVGGGIVWLVRIIGERVMRRETMGFGDVILMAMIGSFMGWQATIMVFFLAPFCSLAVIASTVLFKRSQEIAYGPYLSFAAILVLVFWNPQAARCDHYFGLGTVVIVHAAFMLLMLAITLTFVQLMKCWLGIADFDQSMLLVEWTSADQLAFYANKEPASVPSPIQPPTPTGAIAGQGRQYTDRWRSGDRD